MHSSQSDVSFALNSIFRWQQTPARWRVEAAHLPHLGQLFLLRHIDVRLGDTNGKEASPGARARFVRDPL